MRLRRLRILGIATVLSAGAVALGIIGYLLPANVLQTVNRSGDFIVLNDAMFAVRTRPALANALHFRDIDALNDKLRFIAIDDASLAAPPSGLGAWPWQRSIHGALLKRLAKAGATVVTLDILFLEASADRTQDAALTAGLRAQPTVLGFATETTTGGNYSMLVPPPQLANAARAIGSTTVDEPGGWLIGQPLTITLIDPPHTTYRSLAAATVETATGKRFTALDAWHARFGTDVIPLDGHGLLTMAPFEVQETVDLGSIAGEAARAGAGILGLSFAQRLSYADALRLDDAALAAFARGCVVVVGPSAQALGDFVATPHGRYPGVFVNLRLIDQLLTGTYVERVPPAVDIAMIVLIPMLIGFLVTQLRAGLGVVIGLGVVVLYSLGAVILYGATLRWIDLIHVDGATVLAALFVALYRTVTEGAEGRMIRDMFGKHVSPAIVDEMLAQEEPLKALELSGKRVKVTIFYSDIRGFTAMSEKMSPEEIYRALNEYFEEMCRIVFRYGGFVDKFIGDCLMAVFSAPNPQPDDAYHAVRSAWEQQQKILSMMAQRAAEGRPVFTVGMGLNTGEVVMGNLGASNRLNYTVIGDNVNTAARLYDIAKGGQTIISESTYNEVKDRFIVNELEPVFVKGKELPLRNFEVVGLREPDRM